MGPLFIMGFPRSGTTAMAKAIAGLGRFGTHEREGHLLYLFTQPLARIIRGGENETSVLRAEGAREAFLERFAGLANATFSASGDPSDTMWIDKTPDLAQVRAARVLASLWPQARFIYLYRDPVAAIRSSVALWGDRVAGKEHEAAARWTACQRAWRAVRRPLRGRSVEIFQGDMLDRPGLAAAALSRAIDLSAHERLTVSRVLAADRGVNRPQGLQGDAHDAVALAPHVVREILTITADERARWPRLVSPQTGPASRAAGEATS
ncbi:MAG: sulfotransferase [Pseudomonadota bacterium]